MINPLGIPDDLLDLYKGIRDQDGWETLELTVHDEYEPSAAQRFLTWFKKNIGTEYENNETYAVLADLEPADIDQIEVKLAADKD